MPGPRAFLDVLEDPKAPAVGPVRGPDRLLMRLLAHMLYADDDIERSELALIGRLCGIDDEEDLREYIDELCEQPFDVHALAEAYPDPGDRDDIVTLAEHAIWGDGRVERGEVEMFEDLMEALGVKPG
ncbi:MAG: TerB family tellurite resistance protein [Nannocystaceae bacterium]